MKRRLSLILILTLVLALLAGGIYWFQARQKTWRLLTRAELAIQAENYTKALELASASIARNPHDWRGHYVLAKAHMHLGHYEEAKTILQNLRDHDDTFKTNLAEVLTLLAETYSLPAKQTLVSTGRQLTLESIRQILEQLRLANGLFSQVNSQEEAVVLNARQSIGLNEAQMGGLLEVLVDRLEKEADIVGTTGLKQPQEDRLQQSQKARAERDELHRHAIEVLLDVVSRDPSREEAAAALVQLCLDRKDRESLDKARAAIMPAEKTSPIAKMMLIMDDIRASAEKPAAGEFEPVPGSGRMQDAANQIDELLKQYPDDIQVMLKRAELALLLSDLSTTDRLVEDVLKKNPRQGQARLMKAKRLLIQGETSEAEKLLFALKAEFPNWPEAHYTYGQAAFAGGKRELARQAMRTVTQLVPEHPQARRFLAETLLEDGFYDQAFVDAQVYYRASPDDPQAILLYVTSCFHQEQNDLALQALEKAAADHAAEPAMMMVVAEGYSVLGDNVKMLETARRVAGMSLTTDPADRIAIARGMILAGQSVEAEKILAEDLKKYPTQPGINFELGNIYAAGGRNLQAMERYQEALKHNYKNDSYRLALAQLLLKIGYLEDCQEILDQFETPNTRANVMRLQLKLLQGKSLSSEEMIQISDSQDKTALSLALAALHAGKSQQCITMCKTALEKSPDDADVRMLLGQAYLAQKQLDACAREWQILVQNAPRNLTHYLRLASVWLQTVPPLDIEARLMAIPGAQRDMVDIAMGQILERVNRRPEAIPWYERVIQNRDISEDSRTMARLLMAPILAQQGRLEEALKELDFVIQNQKAFHNRACLLKAQVLAASNRQEEAAALLNELRSRALEQGNSMTLITLAKVYVSLRQQDNALAICEDYRKLDPRNPRAYLLKASVLKAFGQTAKMIECYRSAIQYQPGNFAIYWQLVEALDAMQDRQGALQVLDELAMMGDTAHFASLFERGLLFQRWGLQSHALECFDQLAGSGYGENPRIQMALGEVFKNLGQTQRALEAYQKIPEYVPEFLSAQMRRVELIKTPEEKLDILNRLLTLYPSQTNVMEKKLNVLFDADRGADAVLAFQAGVAESTPSGSPPVKMDLPPLEALSRTRDRKSAAALSGAVARQTDQKWWKQAAAILNADEQPDWVNTLLPEPSQGDLYDAWIALYGTSRAGDLKTAQRWADRARQLEESLQTMNPPRVIPPSQKILIQLTLGNLDQAQAILAGVNHSADLDKSVISEMVSYVSSSGDRAEPLRLLKASLTLELGLRTLAQNEAMDALKARPHSQWAAALTFNAGAEESVLREVAAILQPKECLIAQALYGEVLMLDKKFDQAANVFQRIAATSDSPSAYRLKQGMALENAGHLDEALTVYRQVRDVSPDDPVAANNMAYVVSELYSNDPAKLTEAVDWAASAVKQSPYVTEFRDTYGWILLLQGQSDQACNILRYAIKKMPQNPEVHYHLGMAEKALGNMDYAKWHFAAAEWLGEKTFSEGQSLSPAAAKAVRLAKETLTQMETRNK